MLVALEAQEGELLLVHFDGSDESRNLVNGVESVVKANQTLREEVDLLLAGNPHESDFPRGIIEGCGSFPLAFAVWVRQPHVSEALEGFNCYRSSIQPWRNCELGEDPHSSGPAGWSRTASQLAFKAD